MEIKKRKQGRKNSEEEIDSTDKIGVYIRLIYAAHLFTLGTGSEF
jgi:hypothetical protein